MHAVPQQQASAFEIDVRPARSRVIVTPRGELDLATVGGLEAEVTDLRARGFTAVVLDLRELTFMDSTGLRLLLRLDEAALADGWSFAIVDDGGGPVRRLLELTCLTQRFQRGIVESRRYDTARQLHPHSGTGLRR
jgi:anti-anti-sigma factor